MGQAGRTAERLAQQEAQAARRSVETPASYIPLPAARVVSAVRHRAARPEHFRKAVPALYSPY